MKVLIDILAYREVIKPKAIQQAYIGNNRCHINCLSYCTLNKTKVKSIVGCLQVYSDNSTCAHFIVELKDGSFIDPTFGNMTKLYSYVIPIEKYNPEEFAPNRELQNLKNYVHSLLPWYLRLTNSKNNM